MEMSFKDHYHEVLAVLDKTFRYMFDGLRDKFAPLLKAVNEQYPYEPLQCAASPFDLASSRSGRARARFVLSPDALRHSSSEAPTHPC